MAQATIQPCASDPGRIKPIISGPLEDPGTEAHKEASIEVLAVKDVLPAEEDNTESQPHKKAQKKPYTQTSSSQPPYS